jgi:pimeloyl-ACP methyl ester carboxylesterase
MQQQTDNRERALAGLTVADRRRDVAGKTTAVLEGGDGPPVVVLHGPGESALHWIRMIPSLVARRRAIAPDLPGHGATEPLPTATVARTLEWLDDLIRLTCESPPTLVGTTVGGAIAARFAVSHGDRLESLVLVDTLGLAPFAPEPRFGQALNGFLAQPGEQTHDDLWRVCTYDLDRVREAMGEDWESMLVYNLDRIAAPQTMPGVGALMQEFGLHAIPVEELARIRVPTTLVWGRQDVATSLAVAEAASARYGWPLRVVEECADAPALEQPEALVAALRVALDDRVEVTS